MEFGIFAQMFVPSRESSVDWRQAEHNHLMREVDLAVHAERCGFKYLWATEHHFLEEYSHMSAPEVFLPYVAAKTETMRLGSAIFNITPPVNHPVRVAERVAMLDHITNGRFEFCSGRGSSSTEHGGFGIADSNLTKAMWDEAIGQFVPMWRDHEYAFEGEFFSVPKRNVLPKPYVPPHPPLWVACGNPPTFEKAARMGLGAMGFTVGEPPAIAPMVQAYKKAIVSAEPVGEFVNDTVACVATIICEETREKAIELACNSGLMYYASQVYRWLDTFPAPAYVPPYPQLIPEMTPDMVEERIRKGWVIMGDPDDCARAVQTYVDMGADQIITGPNESFRTPEEVARTIELFGKEVIPRFDKEPGHRTERMRAAGSRR